MRKFLNFRVPAILRIIVILTVFGVSMAIAHDPIAGFVGGFLFWISYFVFQCHSMENSTKSTFLEDVFEFFAEKGIFVSVAISVFGVFYGAFIFITSKGHDESMRALAASLVVYPILTYLFCLLRLILARKSDHDGAAGCAIKYWLPIALVPIWSALIVKYFLTDPKIAYTLCGVILAVMIVYSFITYCKETAVTSAHSDDTESHASLFTEPYHARWENLTNHISMSGETYYIEGTIVVEYDDKRVRGFSEDKANKIARKLLDRLIADVEKKHPECKTIDYSKVVVTYLDIAQ